MSPRERSRFHGRILGVGTTSGTRVVVGHWHDTPLGAFSDAMVETPAGHRVLLAPRAEVRDFIAATYSFDEIRLEPVTVTREGAGWSLDSPSLSLRVTQGRRTALGRLLRLVPARVATSPAWCAVTDPVARLVLRGVRTRGTAGNDRREWYGASDVHAITAVHGSFDGADLGSLTAVEPPARFGFSSTPRRPTVTSVVTTVEIRDPS
ncbi:hypothetical protein [Nocardioides donggukensis]|uniref:Uncharacterized protein n=1 Tax=Nocardioides donggukensis TaxID=2774019 RepID=A0A927Q411_9ACTN|nr:hypothetical protein [Nocardioides donggukensis]MBD8871081.1 hypothetical protein [Nocardioides donggukensis]